MGFKQTYSMIFWRHTEKGNTSFEDISERIYKVLQIFNKNLPYEYCPNYKSVNKKCDVKIYDWNYENFCNDLKKNINHTKECVFEKLGYSLSFFSSLEDNKSFGYRLNVGVKDSRFINVFSVHLAADFNYFNKDMAKILELIFYDCVNEFGAFYACVSNSLIKNGQSAILKSDSLYKITSIQWLNYWDSEILKKFDNKKLKILQRKHKEFSFNNGFIKLKDIPLDAENPEDIKYVQEIESELGL